MGQDCRHPGLAFKADNDDIRESLSYKVKKGLEFQGANVFEHDPYVPCSGSIEEMKKAADVVILCTPHSDYKSLSFDIPVIDVWGFFSQPELEVLVGPDAPQPELKVIEGNRK